MSVLASLSFAQNQTLTKEQAIEIANALTVKQDVNVYISKQTISQKREIVTMYKSIIAPEYVSYLVFIDEHPYESWWHDCKYVFIDVNSGKYEVINMKYPPDLEEMEALKEKKVAEKGSLFQFNKNTKNFISSENEWAVIISGGYNKYNNHVRYWNDCAAVYSALINVYGYNEDHIFVLISDGTNPASDRHLINGSYDSSPLDLDGDGDIQFAATRANITSVFNTLAGLINSDDNLFIYTTDHGGQESGQDAIMYLWNQQLRDDELSVEVNKINTQRINIVMEQCYSGGFLDDLQNNNRVIATASRFDEPSYATTDLLYDEFVYHWTAAIAGELPNGTIVDADANNDNFVSMLEAFNYAKNHDTKNEHPQYSSIPTTAGQYLTLLGIIPTITGTSTVCSSNSTFRIQNRPPNSTISWSCSSNLAYVSGQGTNNYTVRANGNGAGSITATIIGNPENFVIQKSLWIGKPSFGTASVKGPSELTPGLGAVYSILPAQNATNYNWQIPTGCYYNYCWNILSGQSTTSIHAQAGAVGNGAVRVFASNSCGSDSRYKYVHVQDPNSDDPCSDAVNIDVFPNPITTGEVLNIKVIEPPDPCDVAMSSAVIYIIDNMGNTKYIGNHTENQIVLNNIQLKRGLHLIKYEKNNKTLEKRILVK
jgi:hypothetical protein